MLTIVVPGIELYDEQREEFTTYKEFTLELEHSLVSLSKWEAFYEKPFLSKEEKTSEEILGYVKAMTLTPEVPLDVFSRLTPENFAQIDAHINSKQSATWFSDLGNQRPSREVITTELIYYWMVSFNIPFECQYWHLNRLLTLIRIFSVKNAPTKKMSRGEMLARNRALNAQRREQLGTRG